jgi:CheY-like chemotaxis protein
VSGQRVLIVEDDKDIRESLRELLEDEGFGVDCAVHGQDALDVLRRSAVLPSLILLDISMPVMDGFAFRIAQLADPMLAAIPVVVMTADSNVEEKRQRIGCTHALKKPMKPHEVLAIVACYS